LQGWHEPEGSGVARPALLYLLYLPDQSEGFHGLGKAGFCAEFTLSAGMRSFAQRVPSSREGPGMKIGFMGYGLRGMVIKKAVPFPGSLSR
jgi:hypothetical protein